MAQICGPNIIPCRVAGNRGNGSRRPAGRPTSEGVHPPPGPLGRGRGGGGNVNPQKREAKPAQHRNKQPQWGFQASRRPCPPRTPHAPRGDADGLLEVRALPQPLAGGGLEVAEDGHEVPDPVLPRRLVVHQVLHQGAGVRHLVAGSPAPATDLLPPSPAGNGPQTRATECKGRRQGYRRERTVSRGCPPSRVTVWFAAPMWPSWADSSAFQCASHGAYKGGVFVLHFEP